MLLGDSFVAAFRAPTHVHESDRTAGIASRPDGGARGSARVSRAAALAPELRTAGDMSPRARHAGTALAAVESRPRMPRGRELVIAIVLGAGAGTIAALWLTVMEGLGIGLPLGW